ncbi:MAG: HesA/MoeB/ThiF family protein [Gammaproteobacteria bacterium]|jgi:molybdopterin-synthase adenylyltransferase|nr:HesA/MoeB/ThiF family protein [Gammaproteobacteria bacterium]
MLSRDARHLILKQVGSDGQQRIASGTVLLIGAGGIGCAAAVYLASSGVGHVKINDFDTIDETNLGRQVLYTPADLGQYKAEVAAARLRAINPDIQVTAITERLQDDILASEVGASDIILDGCDNFATRFQVNDACVLARRRLISGSAIRLEGQLAVFGPAFEAEPCYRCLYVEADESMDSCAGNGILSPVPGVIGTMMAVEALKYFAGIESDTLKLHLYDATTSEFRTLKLKKRKDCPACGTIDAA